MAYNVFKECIEGQVLALQITSVVHIGHIDCLGQYRSISIANALGILRSWTKPSTYKIMFPGMEVQLSLVTVEMHIFLYGKS